MFTGDLRMDLAQFEQVLANGEGTLVEFKSSTSTSIAKEIAAFANTAGGTIYIGINDHNQVVGCPLTNRMRSEIQSIGTGCNPRIHLDISSFEYNGKSIITIAVPESLDKPVQCSDGFFLREGANSQKMGRDEIFQFAQKAGRIRFESQPRADFKYPDDFDEKKFGAFIERSGIKLKTSIEDLLENLGLGKKNGQFVINNAGVLFFAKRRDYYLRQAYITCVLYKGKTKTKIIDRKDFRDDPVTDYENTFQFLQQHLRLEYDIKGSDPRKEIPEIPYEALKEALVNAIIHRDYFEEGGRIMVEIYDDRVEISNPGGLLFEKKKFGQTSIARNPVILDTFFRIDLAEKVGSGVNRIKELVEAKGLDVKFDVDGYFQAIFQRPKLDVNVPETIKEVSYEDITHELTGNELKILTMCSKTPLSSSDIAEKLGHSRLSGSDRKSLSKLISKKYLEYTKPEKPNITGQKYKTNIAIKRIMEKH